jgi:hypothetical protein
MLADAARQAASMEAPGGTVRLLPAFDTYLLGYARRDTVVPKSYQKHIFHGGQVVPTVLVDGVAAGTWRYERRGPQMRVEVSGFAKFSRPVRARIAEEAEDVARFYGLQPKLSFGAA